MSGFLNDSNVIGRPAELAEAADGAIYVSDDYANAVYRVMPGGSSSLEIGATTGAANDAVVATAGADPRLIVRGATLFGQRGCQECHVLAGASTDGRVALDGVAEKYDRAALDSYLAQPKPPMPPIAEADARQALGAFLLDRPEHAAKVM